MLKYVLTATGILSAFLVGLLMNFNMLHDNLRLIIPPAIAGLIAIGSVYANFLISQRQQKTQITTTVEKEWRTDLRKHTAELIYNGLLYIHTYNLAIKNTEEKKLQDEYLRLLMASQIYLSVLIPNEGTHNIVFREFLNQFVRHCSTGKRDEKKFNEIANSITKFLPNLIMSEGKLKTHPITKSE